MISHFYQKITGWFDFPDVYKEAVARAPSGAHFVEIGSFHGRSAAFMIVEILNSGKQVQLDCVDLWQRLPVETFKKNLGPCLKHINIVQKSSVEASADYSDSSLDFIFIDAGHQYGEVKEDLVHWWPKAKPMAMFAGHDYSVSYPGVMRAVQEFSKDVKIPFGVRGQSWVMYKP